MRSVNKVILIGNLTRDPELRQTPNGQSVATFGLATNRAWVTQNGEKKNSAEFHECVAWARLAEICQEYIKKGHLIYVEGYLKTRNWESPEGIKKFKTEIVVQDMIILEKENQAVNMPRQMRQKKAQQLRHMKKLRQSNQNRKKAANPLSTKILDYSPLSSRLPSGQPKHFIQHNNLKYLWQINLIKTVIKQKTR